MNLSKYKTWLEGYLDGCGVESQKDLTDEQMKVVISKLSEVIEDDSSWSFNSEFPKHVLQNFRDWSIPSWLRGHGHYVEKMFYEDSDGNFVEIENDNGKVHTRSNLKSVEKLREGATKLIGEIFERKSA